MNLRSRSVMVVDDGGTHTAKHSFAQREDQKTATHLS